MGIINELRIVSEHRLQVKRLQQAGDHIVKLDPEFLAFVMRVLEVNVRHTTQKVHKLSKWELEQYFLVAHCVNHKLLRLGENDTKKFIINFKLALADNGYAFFECHILFFLVGEVPKHRVNHLAVLCY